MGLPSDRGGRGARSPSPPSLILNSPVGLRGSFFYPHPHSTYTLGAARAASLGLERRTAITSFIGKVDREQPAGKGHRKGLRGISRLTGMGSWGVRLGKTPGAGARGPIPPALLRARLSCIFSSGDCTAHYYFHMFLQEIIEGKYMNGPLFGMLTGYRNVCR